MNILNRNRNRRKVSASRMSTSADPCETRSLLCAAALPIAELVDAPVDATDETAQSESAQLVDDSANDESDNAEVGTFDVNSIPVDITAFSEDVAPADGELSEDDLSKLPAGIYTMFNVFSAGGGDVDPEVERVMLDRYRAATGVGESFMDAYHVLGAQRIDGEEAQVGLPALHRLDREPGGLDHHQLQRQQSTPFSSGAVLSSVTRLPNSAARPLASERRRALSSSSTTVSRLWPSTSLRL